MLHTSCGVPVAPAGVMTFRYTAVVLVGDHNQLPPVGPGNLLRDLIERQPIPTVVLDQVVRQAGVLKENSIAVLSGDVRRTAEPEHQKTAKTLLCPFQIVRRIHGAKDGVVGDLPVEGCDQTIEAVVSDDVVDIFFVQFCRQGLLSHIHRATPMMGSRLMEMKIAAYHFMSSHRP